MSKLELREYLMKIRSEKYQQVLVYLVNSVRNY